jgi:hypothetical protein
MYWLIVCVEFGVYVMRNGKYQIALTQATPDANKISDGWRGDASLRIEDGISLGS